MELEYTFILSTILSESSKLNRDKVLKYQVTTENVIYESNEGTIKVCIASNTNRGDS